MSPLEILIYIYNSGYSSGHNNTVESQYTDVIPIDSKSYHKDLVLELLDEIGVDIESCIIDSDY